MFKVLLLTMSFMTFSAYAEVSKTSIYNATVMITNKDGSNGGTGVIFRSGTYKSIILTNGHVCDVVENGGLVHTKTQKIAVEKYTKSNQHDLCLVEVMKDLKVNSKLATTAPKVLDKTYVSGHPFLYPNIISEGHLSETMIIQIVLSIKKCDAEDAKKNEFICWVFGGIPFIRELNTNTISNIIAPGNSGSAVYNENNEIVGLVFAGRGRSLSFGIIVPYEYIINFLYEELMTGQLTTVDLSKPRTIEMSEDLETTNLDLNKLLTEPNLIFAAIKDKAIDFIYNEIVDCRKSEDKCFILGE